MVADFVARINVTHFIIAFSKTTDLYRKLRSPWRHHPALIRQPKLNKKCTHLTDKFCSYAASWSVLLRAEACSASIAHAWLKHLQSSSIRCSRSLTRWSWDIKNRLHLRLLPAKGGRSFKRIKLEYSRGIMSNGNIRAGYCKLNKGEKTQHVKTKGIGLCF